MSGLFFATLVSLAVGAQEPVEVDPLVRLQRMSVEPAVPRGLSITIVDAAGAPAAGAIMVVVPMGSTPKRRAASETMRRRFPHDVLRGVAAMAAEFGKRYAVDARGGTIVPADRDIAVFAIAGDATAAQDFRPERHATRSPTMRLELRPPRRIEVQVLLPDGKPAVGVPVSPVVERRTGRLVSMTGRDGAARIVLPELGFETAADKIAILVGTREPLEAAIPANGGPLQFRLPPTGTVRVRLEGCDAIRGDVSFAMTAASRSPGTILPTASEPRAATFAFVEPGATLIAQADRPGVEEPLTAVVPPVRVGETIDVVIDARVGPPRLAMQLRDPEGKPVVQQRVQLVWVRDASTYTGAAPTDREGHVEFQVRSEFAAGGTLTMRLYDGEAHHGELIGTAEVPLAGLKPGINDLGAVQFAAAPVVLAGTAVDKGGGPAAGARLSTGAERGGMHFAIVGADGRFTMRATEALRDELQLECTGDWFPADPDAMVFARGRQDVRLVLRKAARLRVGLPGLPAGASLHLYVECVSPGESKPVFATRLRADTRELDVPAGTWDLVIRLFARECDEVHRIERVVADAGVENHDPRLMELQWQKFLQPVTVRVVGPDGQPTDQCTIWQNFRTRSGTEGTSVSQTRDGIGRLLVPKGGSHVVVRSRNQTWRQADLGIVEADVVARLTQAPRIAVSISAMPDLPEGAILQAMLVAEEGMKADWPSASFDADGKCALLAPATGPFRLQITVRRGNTAKTVGSDGQVAIEVGDRDLEHRFELTEALRRSIAEAAREP